MESFVYLSLSILFWIQGTSGQIVLTQSPKSLFLSVGDPATIKCQSDTDIDDDMNWYQQKPEQPPRLIFSEGNTRQKDVPAQFSSSGYGEDFTLTISSVEAEDEGYYHCQQSDRVPYTFGQGTKLEIKRNDATPSASIFPPSEEQLKTSSATVVCLIDGFYPGDLGVVWKMDGTAATTKQVQTSSVARNTDQTYRLSSTLALSTEEYNSHEEYTCEVTHKTLSQPLVKSFTRTGCSG
ncbi:T-cell surface glycoprotein CD8 beta chain isoform X3 [Pogona vitticeps]